MRTLVATLAILASLTVSGAVAQIPETMSYRAVINDALEAIVTDTIASGGGCPRADGGAPHQARAVAWNSESIAASHHDSIQSAAYLNRPLIAPHEVCSTGVGGPTSEMSSQ